MGGSGAERRVVVVLRELVDRSEQRVAVAARRGTRPESCPRGRRRIRVSPGWPRPATRHSRQRARAPTARAEVARARRATQVARVQRRDEVLAVLAASQQRERDLLVASGRATARRAARTSRTSRAPVRGHRGRRLGSSERPARWRAGSNDGLGSPGAAAGQPLMTACSCATALAPPSSWNVTVIGKLAAVDVRVAGGDGPAGRDGAGAGLPVAPVDRGAVAGQWPPRAQCPSSCAIGPAERRAGGLGEIVDCADRRRGVGDRRPCRRP